MGMPRMLRDLVRELVLEDPTLELAGESPIPDLDAAIATRPHVLVVSAADVSEPQAVALLREHCRLCVVGISGDGAAATLVEMRPHREPLGKLGREPLRAVLRAAGARR
jgi:hypothetical protein